MLKKIGTRIFILSWVFFTFGTCFANGYESFDNIKNVTKTFLLKTVTVAADESLEVQVNQSDGNLRLARCSKDIDASLPKDANSEQINSVELTCNGQRFWHVYVPVTVQVFTKMLVAKHAMSVNDMITADDVELVSHDKTRLFTGYFKTSDEVVGQVASQFISAGTILSKKNTQLPVLVHRDQAIDLVATNNSVQVMMKGVAKSDGRLNETIKAYNPSSKRMLDAVVVGPNRVEVL